MSSLTQQAHERVRRHLGPGEVAVDATAGNGQDALFLAECVGSSGRVYAIDLQAEAIAATQRKAGHMRFSNVVTIQGDHARLAEIVPEAVSRSVKAVMFNLGYLPGGDHRFITRRESTLPAITAAQNMLAPGGVMTIIAYPGHPGGESEMLSVEDLLRSWQKPAGEFAVETVLSAVHSPRAPRLYVVLRLPLRDRCE